MENKLKPYMGYSRAGGASEGAMLIFAHNLKEAKCIGWPHLSEWTDGEYIDMAMQLIKDGDYLFEQMPQWSKEKLSKGIPHVVDSPPSCKVCGIWGVGRFNEQGICSDCEEEIEDDKRFDSLEKAEISKGS